MADIDHKAVAVRAVAELEELSLGLAALEGVGRIAIDHNVDQVVDLGTSVLFTSGILQTRLCSLIEAMNRAFGINGAMS